MRVCSLLLLFYIISPVALYAQENAGFVQGLWYDTSAVFADTSVRIYAAIRNNTGSDLTGTIEFYVNDTRLERTNIEALNNRIIESWADWEPSYGTSTVKAVLSRTRLEPVGSSTRTVTVAITEVTDTIFIDYDTDGDGIGNLNDTNDDGDYLPDDEDDEPLTYNEAPADTEETEDNAETDSETNTNNNTGSTNDHDTDRSGLERYLTDSRADAFLGGVTEVINTTKDRVDTYRASRNNTAYEEVNASPAPSDTTASASSSTSTYDERGFGSVERDSDRTTGVVDTIATVLKAAFNKLFTLCLFLLSLYLAHPAFVQLTLLILILFIIYKLARRLGRRPS